MESQSQASTGTAYGTLQGTQKDEKNERKGIVRNADVKYQ